MSKNGPDRTNAIVDQFMRIAKYAPKEPKQPVTLQEQIDHLEKEKKIFHYSSENSLPILQSNTAPLLSD